MKKDPVVLITGAGKGIGRAVAAELCRRKLSGEIEPRLFLTSRTQGDLDSLATECGRAGVPTASLAVDLSSKTSAEQVYETCRKAFGEIDCLINNAGVGRFGNFLELTEEDLDFVLATNLKGQFFLTQEVFRQMEGRRSGHIVFVTSVAAIKPFEQSAIYCMSKFGQRGLAEVVRLYGRRCNVRVTEILPGAVYTPMWGPQEPATVSRMMKPESIARIIVEAIAADPMTAVEEIIVRPTPGDL